jgi:hypothetical protein
MKTDGAGSFETFIIFHQTTWCHILEDSNLHIHQDKILESSTLWKWTRTVRVNLHIFTAGTTPILKWL